MRNKAINCGEQKFRDHGLEKGVHKEQFYLKGTNKSKYGTKL
jgi:hypothetical protein